MRLNQRRRGTVTSRVTPARHDLKGNQRHRQKYGRGAPGNHPGYAPFRSNAYKRLIFVITSHSRGLYSTGYFDST